METEITLEYGEGLKKHRVIHQELLSCHSKNAKDMFVKAETLRRSYAAAYAFRKQLKQIVSPQMEEETFAQKKLENKVHTHNPAESPPGFV
jgi:hypothetical protein